MTFRNFPTREPAQDAEDGRRRPFGRRVGVRARPRRSRAVVAAELVALAAGAAWLAVQIAQAI
ncbi:hypothetical protein [Hansschlegelia sp. KR7-227]|uniref:hypothetical protein n=1 Tax=Hansschlegelia sp. KR7-227 TaxID=3400914 RepID=UPI003C080565